MRLAMKTAVFARRAAAMGMLTGSLGACGASDDVSTTSAAVYPYALGNGATACGDGDGIESPLEYYYFDRLNEKLAESPDFAAFAKQRGVERVKSCADARKYRSARDAYNLAASSMGAGDAQTSDQVPSQDHGLTDPSVGVHVEGESEKIDKIADGVLSSASYAVMVQSGGGTCSGVLVSQHWLLTAAHCFITNGNQPITVTLGTTVIASGTHWAEQHPTFNGVNGDGDDIALVYAYGGWGPPVIASATYFRRIWGRQFHPGSWMKIYGYGRTTQAGAGLGTRRQSAQTIVTDSAPFGLIGAQTNSGEGRLCKGDSGGPAIAQGVAAGPGFYLTGVASHWVELGGNTGPCPGNCCPNIGEWFYYTQTGGGNPKPGGCDTDGSSASTTSCWIQDTISLTSLPGDPDFCQRIPVNQPPVNPFTYLECW